MSKQGHISPRRHRYPSSCTQWCLLARKQHRGLEASTHTQRQTDESFQLSVNKVNAGCKVPGNVQTRALLPREDISQSEMPSAAVFREHQIYNQLNHQMELMQKCTEHLGELIMHTWASAGGSSTSAFSPTYPSGVPLHCDTAASVAQSAATSGSSVWLNAPQVFPRSDLCKSATHIFKDGAFQLLQKSAGCTCFVTCAFFF